MHSAQADYVDAALRQSATRGHDRMLSAVRGAVNAISRVAGARRTAIVTADCTANPAVGCCPAQQQLQTLSSSSVLCSSVNAFDTSADPPALTDSQIALICSSSCVTDAQPIWAGLNNGSDTTGCANVVTLRVFSDLLCMRDESDGSYCYDTFQRLLSYRNTTANQTNLVNDLCSTCGQKILNYFFNMPLLEREVLNIDRFLPRSRDDITFVCAVDPADNELCLENQNKRDDARNPCKFCGRNAVRAGAQGLDIDFTVEPLLDCGCAEKSGGRSCLGVFVDQNVSYSGNGPMFGNPGGGPQMCDVTIPCNISVPCNASDPNSELCTEETTCNTTVPCNNTGGGGGPQMCDFLVPCNITVPCNASDPNSELCTEETTCNTTAPCSSTGTGGRLLTALPRLLNDHAEQDDFTPCLGLMKGTETTCSQACGNNLRKLVDDVDCCFSCLLYGFNISVASGTLPPLETVLENVSNCSGHSMSDFDACAGSGSIQQNLTIHNMRWSWYNTTADAVDAAVIRAIANAAGTSESNVHLFNVIGGNDSVIFEYELNTTSNNHGKIMAESVAYVAHQGLLDLRPIETLAFPSIETAVYNESLPFYANVTTKESTDTSGASAVAVSSFMISTLMVLAAALLW